MSAARRLFIDVVYLLYLMSPMLITINQVIPLLKGEVTAASWELVIGLLYTMFGILIHHLASMILDKWESSLARVIAEFMQAVAYAYPVIFIMVRANQSAHIVTPIAIAAGLFMQKLYVALLGRRKEAVQTL